MKNCLFLLLSFFCVRFGWSQSPSNVSYVDPTIGGVGILLEPTRPTVHLPNSLVRVFPVRKDQLDDQISYFPLTISSHRQQLLFGLMPYSGAISPGSEKKRFTYDDETTTPYYYHVWMEQSKDEIEFTPSYRSGYFKIHFNSEQQHYLRLNIINNGKIEIAGKKSISGEENFNGMKAFFFAEINEQIQNTQYSEDNKTVHKFFKQASCCRF